MQKPVSRQELSDALRELGLLPLAPGQAQFSAGGFASEVRRAMAGRVVID